MPKTIGQFFVRTLALMPVVFFVWYLLTPALHWPIRWFLSGMSLLGVPEFVTSVQQTLSGFEFITNLTPSSVPGQSFRPGATISAEVDARLYSFGTALLAALTLAAWQAHRWRLLWQGYLWLLPFQMLAVFAVGMKQIVLSSDGAIRTQVGWAPWQVEVIAYLYQFSTLIMPPVTAVVIWLVLHRGFVEKFVGADVIMMIRGGRTQLPDRAVASPRATPMPKRP